MLRTSLTSLIVSLSVVMLIPAGTAQAQERYHLLDHRAPTGTAGRWGALVKPGSAGKPQQVQIRLPSSGVVTFYAGSPQNQVPMAAPAQVGMGVGYVYRFRISDLPEYPGVELYPTVEIIDRIHPPKELAMEFPIPVELSEAELEIAMQDRMVTKVIYLENPTLAFPEVQEGAIRDERLAPSDNLLQAADQRGRPVAILRIGGRIPDLHSSVDEFYCRSPLQLAAP